jgi:thiol-disulfide isomerase/thioredoxin
MHRSYPALLLLVVAVGLTGACDSRRGLGPRAGAWHAVLEGPGGPLPFGLELVDDAAGLRAFLINGPERLEVPRVELNGERLMLDIDHYDSSITATLSADGLTLEGRWRKTAGPDRESTLPFRATAGERPRFPNDGGDGDSHGRADVDGRWAVDFQKSDDPAVGVFEAGEDGSVTGTFLTTTGDYRYLAGNVRGNRLRLSCFDGAHAFLFDARLQEDDTLRGDFWSRDSWHEGWTARRDPQADLPDAFAQTRRIGEVSLAALSFPDLEGRRRSLDDPTFAGRARILELFGSWCPNCNDATAYLVELYGRYRSRGLSIVGLAFEMTGNLERDTEQVRRYAEHHGVEFPLLVAGLSDKSEASRAFPLVDRVRAFPTTLFLRSDGSVHAVHSGYSGPATGEAHRRLRERFEELILELLAEGGPQDRSTGTAGS